MPTHLPAIFVLASFLTMFAFTSAPFAAQVKEPIKDKDKDKEKDKESPKSPEWPTNIGGKGVKDWLKDASEHPDPAVREFALRTLPNFGPDARKICSKKLIERMSAVRETDPGVRITVFNTAATLGLEDEDIPEAVRILGLIVDGGASGGIGRFHAVKTLELIGPKAESVVPFLTGIALKDAAYTTRQSIATTLGRVGFNEESGPNHKALNALAAVLAKDVSAAVRMEALQSLVLLGPPWVKQVKVAKGVPKVPPKVDWAAAATVADHMRSRIGITKKGKEPVEPDKQLEIWCRVVLMRFDEQELVGETHLLAITKHMEATIELGPKLQALQALALFGERAGTQVDKVVPMLRDEDPLVMTTALQTVASMGVKGMPAIPELQKLEKVWLDKREKRKQEEDFKKAVLNLKPDQIELLVSSLQEEQLRKAVANTIKFIQDSKPGKPGGDMAGTAPMPPEKKP